jgi:hypothetical protein
MYNDGLAMPANPSQSRPSDKVAEAIRITFEGRKTHASPNSLPLPPAQWQKPYEALARECGISGQVEDAFAVLRIFLKPILSN